jgi:hypothetical protein
MFYLVCAFGPTPAHAQHACDAIGERGWHTVATVETVAQIDSAPRQEGASGTWVIDRTTTRLPLCNYYNSVGNYSLRSYALSPETQQQRITLCRQAAQGAEVTVVAVAPYAGPCPPQ